MEDNLALPHINRLQQYVPGKPIETLAREKQLTNIIKLASNENPYGPSPAVLQSLRDNLNSLNLYPDPDQYQLKDKLSKFYNISPDMLAIGNGSDELLELIMRAFVSQDNNVIFPRYSFISYQICTNAIGAECNIAEIDSNWENNLENILQSINKQTKLICFANPNNPTGTYLKLDSISEFLNNVPNNILVLLDEAYFEYVKYWIPSSNNTLDNSLELINKYPNLIITRTFSKAYGLAGLRLGYSISTPSIATTISRLKQPFNVNRLVQYAGVAALEDQDYLKKTIDLNNQERNYLYQEFSKMNIKYIPSYTNFITIHTKASSLLYNYLLNQGIIVRPISNYGLNDYLRISIGNHEENRTLINALSCYNKSI